METSLTWPHKCLAPWGVIAKKTHFWQLEIVANNFTCRSWQKKFESNNPKGTWKPV